MGPITALTWALEVGDVQRFSSIKKAISYCGLCGAEKSSGNTVQRTPLSKQRNKLCISGGRGKSLRGFGDPRRGGRREDALTEAIIALATLCRDPEYR